MDLTNRKAGIALFAIAATMKAFNVSAREANTGEKYLAFRMAQLCKHKDITSAECIELSKMSTVSLIDFVGESNEQ